MTMMGYSSSAILTSSLTLSPRSDGLFHRAILISGTNFVPDTFNCSQERNRFLAETSGCDSEGVWGTPNAVSLLPCLRNISIEQLNEIYVRPDPSLAAKFFFPEGYNF